MPAAGRRRRRYTGSMNTDALLQRIERKRDEVVALTQDLVRIPTINPPGDAYEACARLLGERLERRGFAVEYIRAQGAPGDSDSHPRTNVVARLAGQGSGECVHFNSHIDVVEVGPANPVACTPQHDCAGHAVGHKHGPDCGHEPVPHGDHTDYLVGGHLHHPHGGHCDHHGAVATA